MAREITVLYFAAIREAAGASEATFMLPDDVRTVGDLSDFLAERVAGLAGRLASARFAINEEFAAPDARIDGGDIVAVIPPVSGG